MSLSNPPTLGDALQNLRNLLGLQGEVSASATFNINGKTVSLVQISNAVSKFAQAYAAKQRTVAASVPTGGISTQEKDQLLKYISCLESLAISGFKPQASSFGRRRRY